MMCQQCSAGRLARLRRHGSLSTGRPPVAWANTTARAVPCAASTAPALPGEAPTAQLADGLGEADGSLRQLIEELQAQLGFETSLWLDCRPPAGLLTRPPPKSAAPWPAVAGTRQHAHPFLYSRRTLPGYLGEVMEITHRNPPDAAEAGSPVKLPLPVTSSETITAVAHFHRAEIARMTSWRNRIDLTTNWAITVVAGMLSVSLSTPTAHHGVLLFAMVVVLLLLWIEARRYR